MTKSLIATELANAISTITRTNNITSSQEQPRVVVDNQTFSIGMGTTGAACDFTIGIQNKSNVLITCLLAVNSLRCLVVYANLKGVLKEYHFL
jgi:hypothetical protein